jgi:hypothetical protein
MGKLRDVRKPVLSCPGKNTTDQRLSILVVGWGRSRRAAAERLLEAKDTRVWRPL